MAPTEQTLPILVSVPKAPQWLVSRYVIQTGYVLNHDPAMKMSGGAKEFDNNGGTLTGAIQPNTGGGYADTVTVDVSVEYTSESGLPLFQQPTKIVPVTSSGAVYTLALPHRRLVEIRIFFDLPHGVVQGDYLLITWTYTNGEAFTLGHLQLQDSDLLGRVGTSLVGPKVTGFVADPNPGPAESLHLEVIGKYYSNSLPKFVADLKVTQPLIPVMLSMKDNTSGTGYHFELQ